MSDITPKDAADVFARYAELKDADHMTKTGEVVESKAYDEEMTKLGRKLREYLDAADGHELHVEGIGRIRLTFPRSVTYDVKAIQDRDPALFAALSELACLAIDTKVAKPHVEGGRLMMLKQYEIVGATPRLSPIERDGAR